MPSWLADDPTLVYMILAALAMILGVAWWRTKQGKLFLGAIGAILLIGVVWLIGHYTMTDAKRIQRVVEEMAAALQRHDLNGVFVHTSRDFSYHGITRERAREQLEGILRRRDVTEVVVWDFNPESISREQRSATMAFLVKPRGNWGNGAEHYLCRAEFVLEDGQWRMRTFRIFNPFANTHEEITVPGF